MKKIIGLLVCFVHLLGCAQSDTITLPSESDMVSMNDVDLEYGGKHGQRYFKKGSETPFTGWLCARYDNGQLESISQCKDGYANGIWINFDPDGRKESQGTLVNNKTIGPAKLYYEDGSLKAEGKYVHLRNKVGWWKFYDRDGNLVSERFFTR